jgi:integrase
MGIYRYKRRIELALMDIWYSEKILPQNIEQLLDYWRFLDASGKSLPRQDKLMRTVKIFSSLLGPIPFKKATKKDLVRVFATYKRELRPTVGKEPSVHTTSDFAKIVKLFYAWIFEIEDPRHKGYPKVVSWIPVQEPKSTLKASSLLAPDEVNRLIAATPDLRLKALIAVCYDCGLRVGEALGMHIRDINVQEQCASLTVSGKTGPRVAYSIRSLPLLVQWLDQHPHKDNPESWLWTDDTEPLTYDKARFKLQECRRKAGIRKRVYWHLFRHSSATANAELGDPLLRSIYGWSKNSDEPSTYIHLSGEAVKKASLQKAGVQQKTEAKSSIIMCPRCNCPNASNATICVKCKSFLKLEHAVSLVDIQKQVEAQSKTIDSMQTLFETIVQHVKDQDRNVDLIENVYKEHVKKQENLRSNIS